MEEAPAALAPAADLASTARSCEEGRRSRTIASPFATGRGATPSPSSSPPSAATEGAGPGGAMSASKFMEVSLMGTLAVGCPAALVMVTMLPIGCCSTGVKSCSTCSRSSIVTVRPSRYLRAGQHRNSIGRYTCLRETGLLERVISTSSGWAPSFSSSATSEIRLHVRWRLCRRTRADRCESDRSPFSSRRSSRRLTSPLKECASRCLILLRSNTSSSRLTSPSMPSSLMMSLSCRKRILRFLRCQSCSAGT
mmetsp:Transcript_6853/g.22752  ORF Transcript_6853/g.22752 Transcript_6853/m.22752 type:complete len:252 (-) Transcript_6853:1792-2547(-)